MRVYGGDLVETTEGQTGRVTSSIFSLVGNEDAYVLDRQQNKPVVASAIVQILEHGKHDYRVGEVRGHCARCGVVKKLHG